MTDDTASGLSAEHAAELSNDHAVMPDAVTGRIVSAGASDMYIGWGDGDRWVWQLRRGEATRAALPEGSPKYLWPAEPPVINKLRDPADDGPLVLVEGSLQQYAVLSWAPEKWGVYGTLGCRGWEGQDLTWCAGRDIVVIFDADLSTNNDVYAAAERLRDAADVEGAKTIRFVRLPAAGKDGIDDVLARRLPSERTVYLERLVSSAPDRLPRRPPKKDKIVAFNPTDGKPPLDITDPVAALTWLKSPGGIGSGALAGLFGRADEVVFTPREGEEGYLELTDHDAHPDDTDGPAQVRSVEHEQLSARIDDRFSVFKELKAGPTPAMFPTLVARRALAAPDLLRGLRLLRGVIHVPVFRADGTVIDTPGHDAATGLYYLPVTDVPPVTDEPTEGEVAEAVALIQGLIRDFPFVSAEHRANYLGAYLTPLLGPLAGPPYKMLAVDAHERGSGKTLLCQLIGDTYGGVFRSEVPHIDDELRKQITAILATTTGIAVTLDNITGTLRSSVLAGLLTSKRWDDRILGQTAMGSYRNNRLWMVNGNNLDIAGDLPRRALVAALDPGMPHPEKRSGLPNLHRYIHDHRGALIHAGLTLIRAWVVAGAELAPEQSSDSYAHWVRTIGGVLAHAGIEGGFDHDSVQIDIGSDDEEWIEFLQAAFACFGTAEWTSRELLEKVAVVPSDTHPIPLEALPGELTDRMKGSLPTTMNRSFGMWLKNRQGRWAGNLCVRSRQIISSNSRKWHIEHFSSGTTGTTGTKSSRQPQKTHEYSDILDTTHTRSYAGRVGVGPGSPASPGEPPRETPPSGVVPMDLETADKDSLHTYGPGFVRLAGYVTGDGSIQLSTDIDGLARQIESADLVVAHNGMDFDFPALARYHGLDLWAMADRGAVFDTLLAARHLDPPPARAKGRKNRSYDLDTLGERFGLGGKSGDLKAMAKAHGGYDQIPVDDPDYRAYLTRDVELQAAVYAHLDAQLGDADRTYLAREHKVAALAAQLGLNGWRVDTELLAARVAEGDARKADTLAQLAARYDIPLTNGKGEPAKSPLATDAGKAALETAFDRIGVPAEYLPRTEKTGKLQTTGEAMVALSDRYAGHPLAEQVAELCSMVAAVTGERTIYHTISDHTHDGRVYPRVSMDQATGRWSITRPGLTVVGKRGGRHVERDVFLADEGHVLLTVDYSQVDARAVAAHSQDPAYIDMFAPGRDLHAEIATRVWGGPERREDAKAIGHGWNYGMGVTRLGDTTGLGPVAAAQFDQTMRDMFPRLVAWKSEISVIAAGGQLLNNGFGRPMRPDPNRAHTQGPAFMGQGGARDLMMHGLLNLPRELHTYLRAVVHDEVVLSVPTELADDIEAAVVAAMTFEWGGVPIVAEPGRRSETWGGCYAKD